MLLDFNIFCAGCGKEMQYGEHWREPLSKSLVCGKVCLDKVQMAYASAIVGKNKKNG